MNGHALTNLLDPIATTDAVTKQYVDDNFYTQTSADNRYYLNTTTLDNITAPTAALSLSSQRITHLANAVDPTDALNKQTGDSTYYLNTDPLNDIAAPTGDVSLNSHHIVNLATPQNASDAATKGYIDDNFYSQTSADNRYYLNTTTLDSITAPTADLSLNTHKITNLVDPTGLQDGATKNYVDT